jgi:hypothetical protein
MKKMGGKKKGAGGADPSATMGAGNQFSAAQLIQMEMASELVENKKLVQDLTSQTEADADRIAELEQQMEDMRVSLAEASVMSESMRSALVRLDPGFGRSKLTPLVEGVNEDGSAREPAPFDRLAPSVLVKICTMLTAEEITRLGMVCRFLFDSTRADAIWVTFYANEVMLTAPHLQQCTRRERKRMLELPFREQYWLVHPKKTHAMKKADQAVDLAMKRTDEASKKAMEQIKQENLIAKVKEKKEMLDKSQALASTAKEAVVHTQAFDEARMMVQASKGQAVDATDAVMVGQTMLTQLMAKSKTVQNSEKEELKSQADSILKDMQGIAGESVFLSTGLMKAKEIMGKTGGGDNEEITKLRRHGLDLAKNISSPMEAKLALEQNPEFVQEVKILAMGYVDEAVTSAKIPTIKGSKEWGTYQIEGIHIKKLHITEESLDVTITKQVTVTVSQVSADFDEFTFLYDKTTFPKMEDSGKASAQLVDLSSTISFEIVVDSEGLLAVDNVKAAIRIGSLDVQVQAGSHKWLYNKLLKIFNERIKNTVEREVRKTIDKSVTALKHKMSEVTTVLTKKMADAKVAAINDGALDIDDDDEEDAIEEGQPPVDDTVDVSGDEDEEGPVVAMPMPAPKAKKAKKKGGESMPQIEGYLGKQKKAKKRDMGRLTYQRRWFKLEGTKLVYYKSHRDQERVGDVSLPTVSGCRVDTEDSTLFHVEVHSRVFTLKAETEQLAKEWVTDIERARRIAESNVGAAEEDSDEEDALGTSVVVQFFEEHDAATVQGAIRASCLACFDGAQADDMSATLASAEIALATLMGVLDELASTGNLGRQDVVDGYAQLFHELIIAKLEAAAATKGAAHEWDRTDGVKFIAWAADYHDRIESRVDDLQLEPNLTTMPVFAALTDRFVPGHQGYMEKKSPKSVAGKTRWQKRFFVLKDCCLFYYKKEEDYKEQSPPAGMIALESAKELRRQPGSTEITMVVRGRKTTLRVEKESDMFLWLDKVQRSYDVASVFCNAQGGKQKVASRRAEEFDDMLPAERYSKIRDMFAEKLDPLCAQRDLPGSLTAADELLNELTEIIDDIAGCQPPRPDIFEFYVASYNERIHAGVCQYLDDKEVLDVMEKKLVLSLVAWVYSYEDRLSKLGVENVEQKLKDHPAMAHLTTMVPYRAGYLRRRVKRTQKKGVKAYRKQWYELKNCILSWWKEEPTQGQPPLGDIRMDQLRSVNVDGLHFNLWTGDVAYNLLAPSQEELDAWVGAIDQSTMRGIIQAEDFESTATNEAAREAYMSPHVKNWDAQNELEKESESSALFEGLLDPLSPGQILNEDSLEQKLGESFDFVERFCDILEDVGKCYPRRDDAHEWLTETYHKNVARKLGAFLDASSDQSWSQGMIHTLMSWLYSYQEEVERCQPRTEEFALQPQLYDLEAVEQLMTVYVDKMVHVMRTWSTNLLQLEKDDAQVETTPEGACFTVVPSDMFKMITQQMTLAESSGLPKVVVRVCQGLIPVFEYYQTTLSRQIRDSWKKWEVEYLCAQVNDGAKCMELLDDIAEEVRGLVGDEWAEQVDFDSCLNGFLSVSAAAGECIALSFFRDMQEVMALMFDQVWFDEKIVNELIDSTANFWEALCDMIPDPRYVKRIKNETFQQTIFEYIQTILCKKSGSGFHTLSKESLAAIEEDLQIIEEFMVEETIVDEQVDAATGTTVTTSRKKGHLKPKVVGQGVDTVRDVVALMQCAAQKMPEVLTTMLEDAPDVGLGIVDRVITVRGDLKSKERMKILKACNGVIEASEATTEEVDAEGPGTYRVLKAAAVREFIETSSDKVTTLEKGETIEVLETQMNDKGQMRLRYAQGWTSLMSRDGKVLLRKVVTEETIFTELKQRNKGLKQAPRLS